MLSESHHCRRLAWEHARDAEGARVELGTLPSLKVNKVANLASLLMRTVSDELAGGISVAPLVEPVESEILLPILQLSPFNPLKRPTGPVGCAGLF